MGYPRHEYEDPLTLMKAGTMVRTADGVGYMTEKEQIYASLIKLFKMFDKQKDDEIIEMYYACLKEYPADQVRHAMSKAAKECEFCPRPANILKHLKPTDNDFEARASQAIDILDRAVRAEEPSYIQGDPILEHITKGRYSVLQLASMLEESYRFARLELKKDYLNCMKSPEAQKHIEEKKGMLPMIATEEMMRRLQPSKD